jgi:hypothetical protein
VVKLCRTPGLSLLAGGNCPLQMRFGLHGAAGSSFFLRVPYALSPAAYWCVLQMQIGELLETSYGAQYYINDEFLIYEQKKKQKCNITLCIYIPCKYYQNDLIQSYYSLRSYA